MAAELTIQNADGTTATPLDFGLVKPGTSSSVVQRRVTNTGDVTLTDVRVRLEQTSTADGELHGSVGATVLTDAYQVVSASLAPAAYVTVDLYWSTPADATPSSLDQGTIRALADY